MTIRAARTSASPLVTVDDRLAGRGRAIQVGLDLAFLLLAVGIFAQAADPDVLFHGIWVVLALNAFLFGLRVTLIRIGLAISLLLAYFALAAISLPENVALLELDLAEWPLMTVIALIVAVMADRVGATGRQYAELYRAASDRLLTAQEDERRRLGRDLHDGVGQTLTAVVLTLDAAESALWADPRPPTALARHALGRAQELAAIALEETRDVAIRLRPSRFTQTGLVAAIKSLATSAGIDVQVVAPPETAVPGLLPPDAEINVYRIVQEAINNAIRHGHAHRVVVRVVTDDDRLVVSIADDGAGFDTAHAVDRGLGLAGMRERALVVGGSVAVDSSPGAGTRIEVIVPLPPTRIVPELEEPV